MHFAWKGDSYNTADVKEVVGTVQKQDFASLVTYHW